MPPLADSVLAIHLIVPGATQYWIEPSSGITNPSLVRQVVDFGKTGIDPKNIIYDDRTFDAVLVSLGCMGVIYAVVLRVRDEYSLTEITTATTWRSFKQTAAALYFNDPTNRFLQVLLDPYTDGNGDNLCLVTTRKEGVPPSGTASCSAGDVKQAVQNMVWGMIHASPIHGAVVADILISAADQSQGLVDAINYILKEATELREVLARNFGNIMTAAWPPGICGGLSYQVMDTKFRNVPSTSSGGDSIEMFFQGIDQTGKLVFADFVDVLISTINAQTSTFLGGYVAMRFMGGTRASLGMQQWGLTCSVEISTLPGIAAGRDLLGLILELMYQRGGIPHWGQLLDLTVPGHGSLYPRFAEWREVYKQLSNNFALQTFETELSNRWQLTSRDVVMPVQVPDIQGKALQDAQDVLKQLGLTLGIRSVTITNIDQETVFNQRPLARVRVPPGWRIEVDVSRPRKPLP